jgi:hypothetical protein
VCGLCRCSSVIAARAHAPLAPPSLAATPPRPCSCFLPRMLDCSSGVAHWGPPGRGCCVAGAVHACISAGRSPPRAAAAPCFGSARMYAATYTTRSTAQYTRSRAARQSRRTPARPAAVVRVQHRARARTCARVRPTDQAANRRRATAASCVTIFHKPPTGAAPTRKDKQPFTTAGERTKLAGRAPCRPATIRATMTALLVRSQ